MQTAEPPVLPTELSLDPANWPALETTGQQMLADMLHHLQHIHAQPVWQQADAAALASYKNELPTQVESLESAYQEFLTTILPYNTGNVHPRFWGWVQGGGTPVGMLADLLAASMNANTAIGNHSGLYIEYQVLNWCKELLAFPATASGLFTTGASMANLTALTVARNSLPLNIRQHGVHQGSQQLCIYYSSETHNCVDKAVDILGLGRDAVRRIPVDADYRIQLPLLEQAIAADRAADRLPFAIVGNAGTVNTGATDDLNALADVAAREQLWLHIDGAFGALAWLADSHKETLLGMQRADSLAFDLHKWMYMPYELGCLLVKDAAKHRAAFETPATYLSHHEAGLSAGPDAFANYGPELSRGFRALKAWFSFKVHGVDAYRKLIAQNLAQAQYLAALVQRDEQLELLAPIPLNIVCFRYVIAGWDDEKLNALNKQILMQLHVRGLAAPTYTLLQGRYAIRVANTNHRSKNADFEALVKDVVALGDELAQNV